MKWHGSIVTCRGNIERNRPVPGRFRTLCTENAQRSTTALFPPAAHAIAARQEFLPDDQRKSPAVTTTSRFASNACAALRGLFGRQRGNLFLQVGVILHRSADVLPYPPACSSSSHPGAGHLLLLQVATLGPIQFLGRHAVLDQAISSSRITATTLVAFCGC